MSTAITLPQRDHRSGPLPLVAGLTALLAVAAALLATVVDPASIPAGPWRQLLPLPAWLTFAVAALHAVWSRPGRIRHEARGEAALEPPPAPALPDIEDEIGAGVADIGEQIDLTSQQVIGLVGVIGEVSDLGQQIRDAARESEASADAVARAAETVQGATAGIARGTERTRRWPRPPWSRRGRPAPRCGARAPPPWRSAASRR
jgi:hypothetical protein